MYQEKNLSAVIKDVSLTLNIPKATVEHVLLFVFGKVRRGIESGKLETYFLRNFGSIQVKPQSKEKYKERLIKKYGPNYTGESIGNPGGLDESGKGKDGNSESGSGTDSATEGRDMRPMRNKCEQCV